MSHPALRQYSIPSATSSPHQEQDNRGIVASPDNVVSSIDIGTHQRSYVDNGRQRHTKAFRFNQFSQYDYKEKNRDIAVVSVF